MARIRSLKPETPHDRKLATVPRDARLTFLYLVSQADDDGLVRGTPRHLLGQLFPHDEDVTEGVLLGWIEALVSLSIVRWRRTVDGAPVLEIVNWVKHQRIVNRGKPGLATTLAEGVAPSPLLVSSLVPNEGVTRVSLGSRGADRERDRDRDREQGIGKGSTTPAATKKTPRGGWVDRVHQAFQVIGLFPHGRIGKVLSAAVALHGEDAVVAAAGVYATQEKAAGREKWVTPSRLAEQITVWIEASQPISPYLENGEPNPRFLTAIGVAPMVR